MEDENNEIAKLMRKKEADEIRVPLKFLRKAVKTALMLGGQNVTDFDQKTLKMVSPRMMSIVPEQEDESLVGFFKIMESKNSSKCSTVAHFLAEKHFFKGFKFSETLRTSKNFLIFLQSIEIRQN